MMTGCKSTLSRTAGTRAKANTTTRKEIARPARPTRALQTSTRARTVAELDIGRKIAGLVVTEQTSRSIAQEIDPQNPIVRTGRPVLAEQPSGSLTQEIEKGVLFGFESTNVSTRRPVDSCVPVSVERLDQDKEPDENVDADQVRTERPVESEQPIGLFTQREEIDIDFRVSGLQHAVVKQAENFRVRELVKKIESHPHREALQADLQQNSVPQPIQ